MHNLHSLLRQPCQLLRNKGQIQAPAGASLTLHPLSSPEAIP